MPKNILFIMCDQLRWDYLSCYGHPHLHTPNIDRLAERGVRFDRAYANAPICGPSRACFYTGRSMFSNGVYWNTMPLNIGTWTIADYLRPQRYRTVIVGKTHMRPDRANLTRFGISADLPAAAPALYGGFEPFEHDNGIHSDYLVAHHHTNLRYNAYLKAHGYDDPNPWEANANSAVDEHGNKLNGWYMRHNGKPANIAEEHSETPYMTGRAIDCIEAMGDTPWCLHLSYIKPHWPYQVPAPYHNMYDKSHMLPRAASEQERCEPHPVYAAFMQTQGSQHWARDEVRETIVPTYMGMVKQIDDQIGRLMTYLETNQLLEQTLIVFTSDHGDHLGDHWLNEKDTFHEASIRIPLIIVDPSAAADATRGTVNTQFVQAIDIAPTFLDYTGGTAQPHRIEGRSLMPLLHNQSVASWRDCAISETGYAGREPRTILNIPASQCRGYMVRTAAWKYILWEGFAPQLFDMRNDPNELVDLGRSTDHEAIRHTLHERLFTWMRQRMMGQWSDDEMSTKIGPLDDIRSGVLIGYWAEGDPPHQTSS